MPNKAKMIPVEVMLTGIETFKKCYEENRMSITPAMFEAAIHSLNMVEEFVKRSPTVDTVSIPCKIGDTVWGIKKSSSLAAMQGVVYQMYYDDDMKLCICVKGICRGEWGRNVFATKEEVMAKINDIQEMEAGNDRS